MAAAGLIWGSNPLPEAVSRSTGSGKSLPGSAARKTATRALTASSNTGLVGPRFDPADAAALYGNGAVADGRLQKYSGLSKYCPINFDPTTLPSRTIKLPFACSGKNT